jgi:MOSC domain-containing protein YiiM
MPFSHPSAALAGVVRSVNVGLPRTHGHPGATDPLDRPWTTGFFKEPVAGPVPVRRTNLAGDGQADLRVHGGPDKAVLAYAAAHYPGWREELAMADLPFGGFGENLTVEGLVEATVCLGDVMRAGTALLQLAQPRGPCWKIGRRWRRPDLPALVQRSGRTGWYYRVLEEGTVAAGDEVALVERPYPRWDVATMNHVLHARDGDRAALAATAMELAACPALAAGWSAALRRRAAEEPEDAGRSPGASD